VYPRATGPRLYATLTLAAWLGASMPAVARADAPASDRTQAANAAQEAAHKALVSGPATVQLKD
jgi:hypothetical protein